MPKNIKLSQLKPGKRYCFEQPNPTLAFTKSKKIYFAAAESSYLHCSLTVGLNEPVVFIAMLKDDYTVPYYLFLLPDGSIGRLSDIMLNFQLNNKALKIFRADK